MTTESRRSSSGLQTTYSRTLDEILGLNSTNSPVDSRPIPPQRKHPPGQNRSETNSAGSSATKSNLVDSVRSSIIAQDRPTTRHGRSSQSESSSSSKDNGSERKFGLLNNRGLDVWNRDDDKNDSQSITLTNGSRRGTLNRSFNQPSTILEQDRPSSIESSSSSIQSSSHEDNILVDSPTKEEQFETTTQPFKISSSSSQSSSSLSGASQRTYSTRANNEANELNGSLKLPLSPTFSIEDKGLEKEPIVEMRKETASSVGRNVTLMNESKAVVNSEQKITEPRPTLNSRERARPPTKPTISSRPPRPKSSAPQLKPDLDTQMPRLKSSMSTRQLLNDNSPNYTLWLQRTLENDRRKRAEEKARKEEEERKKAEQKENAKKAFELWKAENQRKWIQEQRQKKKQMEEDERQKQATIEEKRKAAEKTFEHWKKTQEEKRRLERIHKMQAERTRSQSVEEQKKRQREENRKAYEIWCESLNERIKEDKRIQEMEEDKRRSQLDQDREFRDSLAKEAYDLWLEMKRKEKIFSHSLAYKILDYKSEANKRFPAPWIPSSPSVSRRFIGTGNRRRTIEKPLNIVQRRARSIY